MPGCSVCWPPHSKIRAASRTVPDRAATDLRAMETPPQASLEALRSGTKARQDVAFRELMEATRTPVPWAYEVWDDVVALLAHPNNRTRAISAQVLCNLAASDPEERILSDLEALVEVTRDERFVTARHCMQSLWRVGVAGQHQRDRLLDALETRFRECVTEKNCTLIRYDICVSLRKVYEETGDERVRARALQLIPTEDDPKYRKKYSRVWPEG
jgi:hypothetical protein